MDIKLQDKLFSRYPKIFVQRKLPMTETCMCWGIDTSNGWYKIIDLLCELLQWDIDHNNHSQIEAVQVKEKFGGLRFYTDTADERQQGMIDFAQHLSEITCEECGSMDNVTQTKGWIVSLCPKCLAEYKKERGVK